MQQPSDAPPDRVDSTRATTGERRIRPSFGRRRGGVIRSRLSALDEIESQPAGWEAVSTARAKGVDIGAGRVRA